MDFDSFLLVLTLAFPSMLALARVRTAASRGTLRCALHPRVSSLPPALPYTVAKIAYDRTLCASTPRWHPTTQKYNTSPISDSQYQRLSNDVLDTLTEHFEALLENVTDDTHEWDIECAVRICFARL